MRANLLFFVYAVSIAAANVLCSHSPKLLALTSLLCSFFIIGLDTVVKDVFQDKYGVGWRLFVLVLGGGVASVMFTPSLKISLASVFAFSTATVADVLVFRLLRKSKYRFGISNIFSCVTDSLIFLFVVSGSVSFYFVATQSVAKLAGGCLWLKVFRRFNVLPL